ncbi:hypothetical protein [Bacillus sp. Au-Bac7]|uniref:hypothetical protein n=1 Tax=Bacillus sp. Au-Bac7 TaxID=2906458 RepID=UPI001E614D81|nr:hypothetical protein [Bacillus sp. Au-Bac7]MCE4048659.1 hypothetical protein [Bacillus sp. Au-Bac7]
MSEQTQEIRKGFNPIALTVTLLVLAFIVFSVFRYFPNVHMLVSITLYFIIDIGFIVAMILGIKTKDKPIMVFSIISNSIFFVLLSLFTFLLLVAYGIGGP